jgi:hypothetical protein
MLKDLSLLIQQQITSNITLSERILDIYLSSDYMIEIVHHAKHKRLEITKQKFIKYDDDVFLGYPEVEIEEITLPTDDLEEILNHLKQDLESQEKYLSGNSWISF